MLEEHAVFGHGAQRKAGVYDLLRSVVDSCSMFMKDRTPFEKTHRLLSIPENWAMIHFSNAGASTLSRRTPAFSSYCKICETWGSIVTLETGSVLS